MPPICVCNAALAILLIAGCGPDSGGENGLLVFAAASTGGAMEKVADRYEEKTGTTVRVNTASTSALARQIESGAPADILLSADSEWMTHLEKSDAVTISDRRNLLANQLVIATPSTSTIAIDDLSQTPLHEVFADAWVMGDPDHVPVGRYGKQALQSLGSWDALRGGLIPALDAAAAANLLALGEVKMGVLYASDARGSEAIRIAAICPRETHNAIIYPVAALNDSETARDFLRFLQEKAQLELFRDAGFQIVEVR